MMAMVITMMIYGGDYDVCNDGVFLRGFTLLALNVSTMYTPSNAELPWMRQLEEPTEASMA